MTAVNLYPWVRSNAGASAPYVFPGKVQAGSTQEIKRGEICVFNETSGYWVPVNAVADAVYNLAIANEEQKSDGLERYMEFIAPREDDVFEFVLAAAGQRSIGDILTLTASDSQKLTYDVDGVPVATITGFQNYPEEGTTHLSISYAEVSFLPVVSHYYKTIVGRSLKKIITTAADLTLKAEDIGAVVHVTAAKTVTAPSNVPAGWWFDMVVGSDNAAVFDPKPDTACVYIAGAKQAAGKYISMTDIADFARFIFNGTDWIAVFSISGADGDITVEG